MIEEDDRVVDFARMRQLSNRVPMARFRVEQIMSAATKMTATLSDEPKGNAMRDKVAESVILLEAARETYVRLASELWAMRGELRPIVEQIDDPTARTCMRMRYIDGVSAKEIACRLNYSERRVFQILQSAEEAVNNAN